MKVATPAARGADPRSVPPSRKLTDPVGVPVKVSGHLVQYYLNLVRRLSGDATPSIEITASAEEIASARKLLQTEGIGSSDRFLVLNPGAAYGAAKRWSSDRFAETADRLAMELGLRVAIIGSTSETPIAQEIAARMKSRAALLTGKTSLETLIGVLAQSSLMITNDSGPMHIAAALGAPTIAVFGSTDDRVTGPLGPRAKVVKHPVDCSPCLLRQCPIDHRCMRLITVDDVCRAAGELMLHA